MSKKNDKRGSKCKFQDRTKYRSADGRKETRDQKGSREAEEVKNTVSAMDRVITRSNSPEWYSKNQQLLVDVANLQYANMLGTVTDLGTIDSVSNQFRVPGVMGIYFTPTPGYSEDLTSPINVAARNVFTTMRKHNSGSVNYDAPDLMMYLLAADSLYMFHSMLKRTYGIIRNYTPYNRYYTDSILSMMGWNPRALRQDIARLRAFTNMVAAQLANLATPATMPLFDRHQWMCEGLYLDSDTLKAQTYVFVPQYYLKFENTTDPNGSALSQVKWAQPAINGSYPIYIQDTGYTLDDAQTFWDSLYTGVMLDEDFNTMSGDLARAFGDSSLTRIMPIPDDYTVLPVYSKEVLSQIENLSVMPLAYIASGSLSVTQNNSINNGAIMCQPTWTITDGGASFSLSSANSDKLLNMHHDQPTPSDTMVASRLMVFANASRSGSSVTISPTIFGSEIVTMALVACAPYEPTKGVFVCPLGDFRFRLSDNYVALQGLALAETSLSTFDWHPLFKLYTSNDTDADDFAGIIGDVDVYSQVTPLALRLLHEVAMLSLFNVQAGDIGLAGAVK